MDEDEQEALTEGEEEVPRYEREEQTGQMQNLNSIDRFFHTESLLYHIKMSLLGYRVENGHYVNTGKGLARTEVVEKIINALRSVINTENMLSRFNSEEEVNVLLREKNNEIIFMLYDEPSVDAEDFEHIVNMTDHPLQLFAGIIQSGEGSEGARQMLSGNYERLRNQQEKNKPLASIATSNMEWLSFGRKR